MERTTATKSTTRTTRTTKTKTKQQQTRTTTRDSGQDQHQQQTQVNTKDINNNNIMFHYTSPLQATEYNYNSSTEISDSVSWNNVVQTTAPIMSTQPHQTYLQQSVTLPTASSILGSANLVSQNVTAMNSQSSTAINTQNITPFPSRSSTAIYGQHITVMDGQNNTVTNGELPSTGGVQVHQEQHTIAPVQLPATLTAGLLWNTSRVLASNHSLGQMKNAIQTNGVKSQLREELSRPANHTGVHMNTGLHTSLQYTANTIQTNSGNPQPQQQPQPHFVISNPSRSIPMGTTQMDHQQHADGYMAVPTQKQLTQYQQQQGQKQQQQQQQQQQGHTHEADPHTVFTSLPPQHQQQQQQQHPTTQINVHQMRATLPNATQLNHNAVTWNSESALVSCSPVQRAQRQHATSLGCSKTNTPTRNSNMVTATSSSSNYPQQVGLCRSTSIGLGVQKTTPNLLQQLQQQQPVRNVHTPTPISNVVTATKTSLMYPQQQHMNSSSDTPPLLGISLQQRSVNSPLLTTASCSPSLVQPHQQQLQEQRVHTPTQPVSCASNLLQQQQYVNGGVGAMGMTMGAHNGHAVTTGMMSTSLLQQQLEQKQQVHTPTQAMISAPSLLQQHTPTQAMISAPSLLQQQVQQQQQVHTPNLLQQQQQQHLQHLQRVQTPIQSIIGDPGLLQQQVQQQQVHTPNLLQQLQQQQQQRHNQQNVCVGVSEQQQQQQQHQVYVGNDNGTMGMTTHALTPSSLDNLLMAPVPVVATQVWGPPTLDLQRKRATSMSTAVMQESTPPHTHTRNHTAPCDSMNRIPSFQVPGHPIDNSGTVMSPSVLSTIAPGYHRKRAMSAPIPSAGSAGTHTLRMSNGQPVMFSDVEGRIDTHSPITTMLPATSHVGVCLQSGETVGKRRRSDAGVGNSADSGIISPLVAVHGPKVVPKGNNLRASLKYNGSKTIHKASVASDTAASTRYPVEMRCRYPGGCVKRIKSRGLCIGHGGGKRCTHISGCTKSAQGGTALCAAHGGGTKCQHPDGCSNCARGGKGAPMLCVRHGGGERCAHEGCSRAARNGSKRCKAHLAVTLDSNTSDVRRSTTTAVATGSSPLRSKNHLQFANRVSVCNPKTTTIPVTTTTSSVFSSTSAAIVSDLCANNQAEGAQPVTTSAPFAPIDAPVATSAALITACGAPFAAAIAPAALAPRAATVPHFVTSVAPVAATVAPVTAPVASRAAAWTVAVSTAMPVLYEDNADIAAATAAAAAMDSYVFTDDSYDDDDDDVGVGHCHRFSRRLLEEKGMDDSSI